jgi:gliding motility-associated-like protein
LNHTKYIVFFLLFTACGFGQQNLILNGDFEEYWECPNDATQIERCKHVYNPCLYVPSTSDYFNACYIPGSGGAPVGVPNTFDGYQNSKNGNGMVGLGFVDATEYQYREYIQLSFYKSMECGKKYLIEGYFNLGDLYRYTIKNIGFLFSEQRINSNDYLYNNYSPQYTDTFTLIDDTVNWIKISFEYIADASHSFLTIGHFLKDSTESYVEVNPQAIAQSYACYFYLDDFRVTELDNIGIRFPNVFTPNGDGINDFFKPLDGEGHQYLEEINILNRWGNEITTLKPPFIWNGLTSDGAKVLNGVYYYVTKSKVSCKNKKEQIGIIHVIY